MAVLSVITRHESLEKGLLDEVEGLKLELSRANQLVSSLQKKGGEVLHMSPAAAKASALLKSGMSLTQIYSKYVEVRMYIMYVYVAYVHTSYVNAVRILDNNLNHDQEPEGCGLHLRPHLRKITWFQSDQFLK